LKKRFGKAGNNALSLHPLCKRDQGVLRRKAERFWIDSDLQKKGLEKKMKNNFGREKNLFYLCSRF